jgi:platelet-activating factor acetylhydrolase
VHLSLLTESAGTAHPSCTDAPLIVPGIMKMVTGTTLDPRIALREYIDTSEVTSKNGPLGDAGKREKVRGQYGADWEVHVVPSK